MKLAKIARNVILAGLAWRYIARRRAVARQERRLRMVVPVLIAGGAVGVIWVTRRQIGAVTRRALEIATPQVERRMRGGERAATSSVRPSAT